MKVNFNYLCRLIAGLSNNHPVVVIPDSSQPPTKAGEGFHFTTPGGRPIQHPNAYHWPKIYHNSTLHCTVGANWRLKVPKGMELRLNKGCTYLVRLSDGMDLHFLPCVLLRKDFCTWARREMATSYKNRLVTKKIKKDEK